MGPAPPPLAPPPLEAPPPLAVVAGAVSDTVAQPLGAAPSAATAAAAVAEEERRRFCNAMRQAGASAPVLNLVEASEAAQSGPPTVETAASAARVRWLILLYDLLRVCSGGLVLKVRVGVRVGVSPNPNLNPNPDPNLTLTLTLTRGEGGERGDEGLLELQLHLLEQEEHAGEDLRRARRVGYCALDDGDVDARRQLGMLVLAHARPA